jgi:hypothetical protein
VIKEAGPRTAVKKSFDVTVSDGVLDLTFGRVTEDPMLSGLAISTVSTSTSSTTTAAPAPTAAPEPTTTSTTTSAPAPAPTTSSTPAPTTTTSAPSTGAFPNASTTGVPEGVALKPWTGGRTITQAGTVIDGYLIEGGLEIRADNVTIKNSLVRGGRIAAGYGSEQTGLMIMDTTLDGQNKNPNVSAVGDANFTCIRCDVHGFGNGFRMYKNVTVQDSWIHDLCCYTPGDHRNAIGSNGGSNFTIKNNVIDCGIGGCSGALTLYGDFAPIENVLVERNLLMTVGGYCTHAGSDPGKAYPRGTNIRYLDNHFSQKYNPTCGGYGPVVNWANNPGNLWSGNVYHETKDPIRK